MRRARAGPLHLLWLLRSPQAGLLGAAVRFALNGGLNAIFYVTCTTLLADVAGLPFQLALALSFSAALCLNFLAQRHFVWATAERYALPAHHQAGRYLLLAGAQYGVTALGTLLLPRALGLPTEAVYIALLAVLSLINFLLLRHRIFHAAPASAEPV
jgi:putative flippase GtrA